MPDITIETLKAELVTLNAQLSEKTTLYNSNNDYVDNGRQKDSHIDDIVINGYTLQQYAQIHPKEFQNAPFGTGWYIKASPVAPLINIQYAQTIIDKMREAKSLAVEIGALNERIRVTQQAIADLQKGQVSQTVADAGGAIAGAISNNLPLVLLGVGGLIALYFWVRSMFKKKSA